MSLGAGAALTTVGRLGTQIADLHDKTVTIHVNRTGAGLDFISGGASLEHAAGGIVATTREPSIPTLLTDRSAA